jgi:hypothetical protein
MRELIETTRRHFIGRSRGHNVNGQWIIGPVLVDVVTLDAGARFTPIYVVEIDGRHAFGGPVDHLDAAGLPPGARAGDFGRHLDLEPDDARRHPASGRALFAPEPAYPNAVERRLPNAVYDERGALRLLRGVVPTAGSGRRVEYR